MKYYDLNFTGFVDKWEDLLPGVPLDEDVCLNFNFDVQDLIEECAKKLNQIGLHVDVDKIVDCRQISSNKDVATFRVIYQDRYELCINEKILTKPDYLEMVIYHELCHLYQLSRLFEEKIIFWSFDSEGIQANEKTIEAAKDNLVVDNGHAGYWKYAADLVNEKIDPEIKIVAAFSTEELQKLLENFIKKTITYHPIFFEDYL